MKQNMEEKDSIGLSQSSSTFRRRQKGASLAAEEEIESQEEELELGLSLGASGKVTAATTVGCKNRAMNRCRILTAEEFMESRAVHDTSRASPISSSSSSSIADCEVAAASANPPSQAVGWPPIGFFRVNNLVNQSKENNIRSIDTNKKNDLNLSNIKAECVNSKNQETRDGTSNSNIKLFVKVNMDGDLIGRKVDLNAHHSYESLALALEIMFHKPTISLDSSTHGAKASKLLDGSSEFVLTYEDKDGDWMLVGDVPWEMFLDTVRRLKIMRTCDANGLAPRFQSSTRGLPI